MVPGWVKRSVTRHGSRVMDHESRATPPAASTGQPIRLRSPAAWAKRVLASTRGMRYSRVAARDRGLDPPQATDTPGAWTRAIHGHRVHLGYWRPRHEVESILLSSASAREVMRNRPGRDSDGPRSALEDSRQRQRALRPVVPSLWSVVAGVHVAPHPHRR